MISRLGKHLIFICKQAVEHIHCYKNQRILLHEHFRQPYEYPCKHLCVITATVVLKIPKSEMLRHIVEFMLFKLRKHYLRHWHSVYRRIFYLDALSFCAGGYKARIELRIVRHKNRVVTDKLLEFKESFPFACTVLYHIVSDVGEV